MSWLDKIFSAKIRTESNSGRREVPEGVWRQCPQCDKTIYQPELVKAKFVCPHCSHHMRIGARDRLAYFLGEDAEMTEIGADIEPTDTLKFTDTKRYKDRLSAAQKKTNETDALIVVSSKLDDIDVVVAAFEFGFLGGSMGSVVGARFVAGVNAALEKGTPFICFTASGGARMQESLFSLMQMAKVSAALARLKAAGLPYVVILTDPTTGGVSASLAMLGDLHLAEPNALIGFAGPRVIEQTVREVLPEGFQRSEFLQEKGMVDMIVSRADLPVVVPRLLKKLLHYRVATQAVVNEAEAVE